MDLEIPEEERYVEKKRDLHMKSTLKEGEDYNTYVVIGSFVDRLLASVNIHDADSLRYFHKVLNKGKYYNKLERWEYKTETWLD